MMLLRQGAFARRFRRQADLLQRHPNFYMISQDSIDRHILPAAPIPNAALILFVAGGSRARRPQPHRARPLHLRARQQRGGGAALGRQRRRLENRHLRLGGAICGVAGLIIASRLNSAQPALGQGYELEAIAAVVIGGTSLSGGSGTILGTIIGAFIMSVLTNGLRIMSVAQEWQIVVTGVIIILAVYADILRRKRA